VIAAYTITAPVTIAGSQVTPQGQDVIVAELTAQGLNDRVLAVLGI
jgi:hypothetical protein